MFSLEMIREGATRSDTEVQTFRLSVGRTRITRVNIISHETGMWHRVEFSWNVMAHGGAREGKWRGNWRMEWVASTKSVLYTTSENCISSITTADARSSAASSQLNWRPCRFKLTRPFRWKTKSSFCACAITFQTQSTYKAGVPTARTRRSIGNKSTSWESSKSFIQQQIHYLSILENPTIYIKT
jgi:hypothetical protein